MKGHPIESIILLTRITVCKESRTKVMKGVAPKVATPGKWPTLNREVTKINMNDEKMKLKVKMKI